MFRCRPIPRALVALVVVLPIVPLEACRHPPDRPGAQAADQPPISLAAMDSGATLLADVDNARAAIADKDDLAATNDLAQADAIAVRLPDGSAQRAGATPAPLSAFDAEVMLTTAQSRLDLGDVAGADAALAAVQPRVRLRLAADDMPLLRAEQSLDIARIAVASDQAAELRTQLRIAEASLDAYRGHPHAADVSALAAVIDKALKRSGCLQRLEPERIDVWLDHVDGWA